MVRDHLEIAVLALVALSVLPMVIEALRRKLRAGSANASEPEGRSPEAEESRVAEPATR